MDFEAAIESFEGSEEQSKEKLYHLRSAKIIMISLLIELDVTSATSESSEGNEEQVNCTLSTKQNL